MKLVLVIALGGGLGAVSRHLLNGWVARLMGTDFPWGILAVNVIGSLLMGMLVEWMALRGAVSNEWRAFLTVGILGGFTTFSSFSLDTWLLIERGQTVSALAYVALSVGLAIAALAAGLHLTRLVLA
jgi:fluoride exporter